jgi:hypothetical protein
MLGKVALKLPPPLPSSLCCIVLICCHCRSVLNHHRHLVLVCMVTYPDGALSWLQSLSLVLYLWTCSWLSTAVLFNLGCQYPPGVREGILWGASNKTKHRTAWAIDQLWSSQSRRFVPELRCWHARNKLNHLVNSQNHINNWSDI